MAAASTLSARARPFTNSNSPPSSAPVIRTPAISLSSPSTLSAHALPFIKSSSLHVPADSSSQPLSPSPLTPSSSSSGLVNRAPAISPSPSTLSAQATPFTKDSCLPFTADFSSPSPPPPPPDDTPYSASGRIIQPLAPSNLRAQARPYTKDSSVHVTADFSSLNPPPPSPPSAAAAASFGIITPHPTTSSSSSSLRAEARPFTKGSSTANFSSPPPTPPPPPIHTPFSTSSGLVIRPLEISPSPSNLSPEAIPYTADRPIHPKVKTPSLTLSAAPYTPLSTHVNDRPSLSSSFAPRSANSIPQSGVVGPPYYPPSAPPFVDSLALDDDDDVSMEPWVYPYSSYQVSSLPKGIPCHNQCCLCC